MQLTSQGNVSVAMMQDIMENQSMWHFRRHYLTNCFRTRAPSNSAVQLFLGTTQAALGRGAIPIGVNYVSEKADKDSGVGKSLGASSSESHASPIPSSSISRSPLSLRKSNTAPASVRNIYSRSEYSVGILCGLAVELKAVRALFDQRHQHPPSVIGDNNQYALEEMARHMVVATALPAR
ncbi:hypothetical protein LB503_011091 [Fusarium chuoi]|nr:hypothetical protein LB503_011091 [Fusarium chuoi]